MSVPPRALLLAGLVAMAALALVGCATTPPASSNAQTYKGTAVEGEALDFELTDQEGNSRALSDFRGKVVVLAFLDPHCTDICPLTASQFRLASQRMQDDYEHVAFVAVNVNPDANTTTDTSLATQKWDMGGVQNWHFLTGTADELEAVWKDYGIQAGGAKPDKQGQVIHTPGLYVIDQSGEKRWYISVPFQDASDLEDLVVMRVTELL